MALFKDLSPLCNVYLLYILVLHVESWGSFFPRKPPNSLIYIPCPHSNRHTQIGGWIDNLCLEAKCLRMTIVMRGAKKKTFYLTEFLNGFLIMNTYGQNTALFSTE